LTIESSAPGKLILFGEHASSRGRPAIVFATNTRVTMRLKLNPPHYKILISSLEYNAFKEEYPSKKLDLVTNIISYFFEKVTFNQKPFELEIESDVTSGFGSSAAVLVSLIGALNEAFKTNLSKLDLLKLGIDINQSIKGYGSGLDIATSLYGGLLKFQQGKKPEQLPFDKLNLVVGNTGIKAPSGPIVKSVREFEQKDPITTRPIFDKIASITSEAEDAILEGDSVTLGSLMNENHALLKKLNVSSDVLEEMITAAKSSGALGAKLSGAGKGDNMLALVQENSRDGVIHALNRASGKAMPDIKIDSRGLTIRKL